MQFGLRRASSKYACAGRSQSLVTRAFTSSAVILFRMLVIIVFSGGVMFGIASAQTGAIGETPSLPFLFRPIVFAALLCLPGAWIGFAPPTRALGAWFRLILSFILSPIVLFAQFYALRFIGVSVSALPIVLMLVNAPAAYFIFTSRRQFKFPEWPTTIAALAVLALPLCLLAYSHHDEATRVLRAHNWLHADIVYQFLAGKILPEEMAYVGAVAAYPWTAHVYQAILSATLDLAPSSAFALTNIAWLLALFGCAALTAKELGGGRIAQITAPIWVVFATNPIGLGLRQIIPPGYHSSFFGDLRYTSILRKYYNFNQTPFAFAIVGAMAYLAIVEREGLTPKVRAALLGVVLFSLTLIYPLFLPVGCGIICSRIVAIWFSPDANVHAQRRVEAVSLFLAMFFACVLAFPILQIFLQDRLGAHGPRIDFSLYQIKKVIHTGFALSLPVLAFLFVVRRHWPKIPTALMTTGITALGLIALYIFVEIPNWRNEYKFIMAATVVLAPFVGVAFDAPMPSIRKRGQWLTIAMTVAACLAVVTPASIRLFTQYGRGGDDFPKVYVDGLDLKYAASEPLSGSLDAIRENTPPSTLIISTHRRYYLPTIAQRTAFTNYDLEGNPAGIGLGLNYLLFSVKGYDRSQLPHRMESVTNLYFGADDARLNALNDILAFQRPVALIVDRATEQELELWLRRTDGAASVYEDGDYSVWLVEPVASLGLAESGNES